MSPEENDRLEDLVDLWEDSRERGTPVSPEDLCRDCPELLEELKRYLRELEVADRFLISTAGVDRSEPSGGAAPEFQAGRYQAQRLLDRGGFAEVFVAYDAELRRPVALKCPKTSRAWDREGRARFVLEAEVTGRLEHPGIVPVYGLGQDSRGYPYYAMRLVGGQTLDQAIEAFHVAESPQRDPGERALAFQKLLRAFLSVCEAIGYAHSRGVLHRDIKPANIRVGDYGEVLVLDWGLAKIIDSEPATGESVSDSAIPVNDADHATATGSGQIKGTPAYMSPEQASGDVGRVGLASDIYGLGATLYKLLVGRAPFGGELLSEVLRRVRQGEFIAPRHLNASIPRGLEAICLKAMQKEPAERYPTALAVAEDLEHWLADEPVSAWREPLLTRARRWLRRHRTVVAATTTAMVVTIGLLAGFTVLLNAENQKLEAANSKLDSANQELEDSNHNLDAANRELEAANQELKRSNAREVAARETADRNLEMAFRHVREIAGIFHHPQLTTYRNTLVFRLITESLLQQLDKLADLASSTPYGEDLLLQREVFRLFLVMGQISAPDEAEKTLAELREVTATLRTMSEKNRTDLWTRFYIGLSHFAEAQLLWGAGKEADADRNALQAYEIFVECSEGEFDLAMYGIEHVAAIAAILAANPERDEEVIKGFDRIETALRLIDRAVKDLAQEHPVFDRLTCWKAQLLANQSSLHLREPAKLELARTEAQSALETVDTIIGSWREHPLYFRARWSARFAYGRVLMTSGPTVEAWNYICAATEDLETAIELVPGSRTEFDRKAILFNELGVAQIGSEVIPKLGKNTPEEQETIRRIFDRSLVALQRCEALEELAPETQRDFKMTVTLRALRQDFARMKIK
jgi:serine/threonine protein kinase